MSAHWLSHGVTLFTAVINTNKVTSSYVVISNELHHDKYAVAKYNRAILEAAEADGIEIDKLHIFTDGAGSQFKNRFSLSNIVRPNVIYKGLSYVDWSFFGTAHGKGPVDGVGGTVKRAVWRRILQKRVVLNTAEEFFTAAKDACPNINIIYVEADRVAVVKKELDGMWETSYPLSIPDTRGSHYFRSLSANELQVAKISPFMDDVNVGFSIVKIFKNKDICKYDEHVILVTEVPVDQEENTEQQQTDEVEASNPISKLRTSEIFNRSFQKFRKHIEC